MKARFNWRHIRPRAHSTCPDQLPSDKTDARLLVQPPTANAHTFPRQKMGAERNRIVVIPPAHQPMPQVEFSRTHSRLGFMKKSRFTDG